MISTPACFAAFILVAALGLPACPAGAEVYRYVDDDGMSHFSDSLTSVPPRYRDQVADISEELRARSGFKVIPGLNQGEGGAGEAAGARTGFEPNGDPGRAESFDFQAEGEQAMRATAGQLWSRFGVVLLVGILLFALVGILLSGSILMLACKLAAPETPGLGRACAVVLVQGLVGMAVSGATAGAGLALGISHGGPTPSLALTAVSLSVSFAAYAGVLSAMTELGFPRALWVMVVYFLLVLLIAGVLIAIGLLSTAI